MDMSRAPAAAALPDDAFHSAGGLCGVVMAGGRSSRMGRDKGRELFGGVPMAVRLHTLMRGLLARLVVSVNEEQREAYGALFPPDILVVDSVLEVGGPLRGILSAHASRPESDLLVVACDMPLLGTSVLARLIEEHTASPEAPFVAFDSDGIQPLCAIYRAAALAEMLGASRRGVLPPSCPRRLLASTEGTRLLSVRDESERLQFTNVNRPAELEAARSGEGAGA